MYSPYSRLHSSKTEKRTPPQLWEAGGPAAAATAAEARDFLISEMLPSRNDGGGPSMPCCFSTRRCCRGAATRAVYSRKNSLKIDANRKDRMV